MKLLLENWQKYLAEEQSDVKIEKEDQFVTYRLPEGYITVIENSPYAGGAHSIYQFYVDEAHRGEGIGTKLVKVVMDAYQGEEISAQVSSLSSLKVFFNLGFREPGEPDSSFKELEKQFAHYGGSLNVRLNHSAGEAEIEEGIGKYVPGSSEWKMNKATKELQKDVAD